MMRLCCTFLGQFKVLKTCVNSKINKLVCGKKVNNVKEYFRTRNF